MGGDNNARSAPFLSGRSISVYRPKVFLIACLLGGGEFCYEIDQCLSFDGRSWTVFYIKLAELDGLLYHSSWDLRFVHRFFDGLVRHYYDRMSLEVRTKFS